MQMKKKPAAYRPSAVEQRREKMGRANQMDYELDEKIEREKLKKKVGKAGRKPGRTSKPAKDPSGMSSGLMGSSLRSNFSGMARDKGRSARAVGY